jgi:catechol 2,3-dioxygenase-like lactoylglutathione lyase family enzyme
LRRRYEVIFARGGSQPCSLKPEGTMITASHVIIYSKDAEADRKFFRDVLNFSSVDAGHGWLIFALPPSEAAFHPAEKDGTHELYFMCDDLKATMKALAEKNVRCGPITEQRWGSVTEITLPSGGQIGLYEPKHPTAIGR